MTAADTADIACFAAEHLRKQGEVTLMPRRHDDNIVILRGCHRDSVIGTADNFLCLREVRLIRQLRAIIIKRHTEADVCKHRHQCLSHMTADEHVNATRAHQRFGINQRFAHLEHRTRSKEVGLLLCRFFIQNFKFRNITVCKL